MTSDFSGKCVACCTYSGVLHLFATAEQFTTFTRENSNSVGLVMAWVDGVVYHDKVDRPLATDQPLTPGASAD